jgi:hypothetical protein
MQKTRFAWSFGRFRLENGRMTASLDTFSLLDGRGRHLLQGRCKTVQNACNDPDHTTHESSDQAGHQNELKRQSGDAVPG